MKKQQPVTELGTQEIHRKHAIMVEGGTVPRARVIDQMMIDRYLMQGEITLAQHQAGEYLLEQASKAGMFAKAPPMGRTIVDGNGKPSIPGGLFAYGRTVNLVKRRYGVYHAYLVQEVVCHNWDVGDDEKKMDCLRDALQVICDRRISGGRSPARHLKK
jgi:hypothetical protein